MALARLETTLPEDVLGDIANRLLRHKSPLYDDGDLARDAVSLLMVAKATPLKDIGLQLCSLLCPYLGKASVDCVTAVSKAPAIKAKLKALGQPHTGNKPELVQRLSDMMKGATPHSPVSNALRARTLQLKETRITDHAAKKTFNLHPSKTPRLRESGVQEASGNHFGGGYTVTYRLQDVKVEARKSYRSYDKILEAKSRSGEWMKTYQDRRDEAKAALQAELQRRGVAAETAATAVQRWWCHPYLDGDTFKQRPILESAATDFEHDIFLRNLPTYYSHLLRLRMGHVYRSSLAKYKQDRELVERAQELALVSWVRSFAGLEEALGAPGLPPGLRARVTRASSAPAPAAPVPPLAWAAGPCPDCGEYHDDDEGEFDEGF